MKTILMRFFYFCFSIMILFMMMNLLTIFGGTNTADAKERIDRYRPAPQTQGSFSNNHKDAKEKTDRSRPALNPKDRLSKNHGDERERVNQYRPTLPIASVSEPSTLALMGAGIAGIGLYRYIRRRNRSKSK